MISEARYKTVYAVYSFIISFTILEVTYLNHARIYAANPFDVNWANQINLIEVGISSVIAIFVCLILMYAKQLHFAPWKFLYGAISAGVIFLMEFVMVFIPYVLHSRFVTLRLLAILSFPALCVVWVGLIIYGCVLRSKSRLNILFDDDCEIVSAILIANIAVMLVTVLAYVILLCLSQY